MVVKTDSCKFLIHDFFEGSPNELNGIYYSDSMVAFANNHSFLSKENYEPWSKKLYKLILESEH